MWVVSMDNAKCNIASRVILVINSDSGHGDHGRYWGGSYCGYNKKWTHCCIYVLSFNRRKCQVYEKYIAGFIEHRCNHVHKFWHIIAETRSFLYAVHVQWGYPLYGRVEQGQGQRSTVKFKLVLMFCVVCKNRKKTEKRRREMIKHFCCITRQTNRCRPCMMVGQMISSQMESLVNSMWIGVLSQLQLSLSFRMISIDLRNDSWCN